jgi:hypothetical protein
VGVEGESAFKDCSVEDKSKTYNRGQQMLKKPQEDQEDLLKCPVCEIYFNKAEGFICIRCKKGPLCKRHKIAQTKECASCVFDRKLKELAPLKGQESDLRSFLRLLQFIFLVFAIFFIALKMGLEDTIEFLQYGFIQEGLLFMGIAAVFGYILFYYLLYNLKNKIVEHEAEIKKIQIRR